MKANQFLRQDDDAVSPVIAVILMVAITVVLAATVYVWVSGFGSNTGGAPAHTMSMTSAGPIASDSPVTYYTKQYTVSSADPSLVYGDMKITVAGAEYTFNGASCAAATLSDKAWSSCAGATQRTATSSVSAGDTIIIKCTAAGSSALCLQDKDLLILDTEANSVMITLKVR